MLCFCDYDYDQPSFISKTAVRARKPHRCSECGCDIQPGDTYRRIVGKWDGEIDTFRWCDRCVAVHEYIKAHVPCFCWMYGSMLDDALECAAEANDEAPGLWFAVARRVVAARRGARAAAT